MILFFSESEDDQFLGWAIHHLSNKMLAVFIVLFAVKLIDYWNPRGKIDTLAKFTKHLEDLAK